MAREATVEIAYVPFKTFITALETLRQGIPDPVDKSVFRNQSFSTQAMIISTLKALGAIDEGGHKQPILERLVSPSERETALKDVLEDKYRAVLDLGLAATEKQFDDTFAGYGVTGDTRKKAKSFFLQAAAMAGIPLSPHIPGARTTANGGNAPKSTRARARGGVRKPKRDESLLPLDAPPVGTVAATWRLPGGGIAKLIVTSDAFTLPKDVREKLFKLADQMRDYDAKSTGASQPTFSENGTAES